MPVSCLAARGFAGDALVSALLQTPGPPAAAAEEAVAPVVDVARLLETAECHDLALVDVRDSHARAPRPSAAPAPRPDRCAMLALRRLPP